MPVAFTQEILSSGGLTSTVLRSWISTKLASIGYTKIYETGDDLYFSIDAPLSGSPKDLAYLRLNISQPSGTSIKCQMHIGDGFASNSLQNASPCYTDAFVGSPLFSWGSGENVNIKFLTFKSPEIAWVGLFRSDNNQSIVNIGFVFPVVKPPTWNDNFLFAFAPKGANANSLTSPAVNPISSGATEVYFGLQSTPYNPDVSGERPLIKRLLLSSSANPQIVGQSSPDLAILASNSLSPFQEYIRDGQTFINISNNAAPCFAVRIA